MGGGCLIWVCLPWNYYHRVVFLVNMESLQDNHDKLVFECFYHYSHLPFRTLICHRLFQNKFIFRVLNFGSPFKVPITLEYFFRWNKSLHLFETHFTFLPLFNPNIDLLQAVKVTKSGHHLSHDRASKGYWSTPCLTSQTSLHACLQRLNTLQISLWRQTRNRPMPLLARSCDRWWLDFVTFTT